jgi:hypothetical protein
MTVNKRDCRFILRIGLSLGLCTTMKLVVRLVAMAFLLGGGVSGVVRSLPTNGENAVFMWQ